MENANVNKTLLVLVQKQIVRPNAPMTDRVLDSDSNTATPCGERYVLQYCF